MPSAISARPMVKKLTPAFKVIKLDGTYTKKTVTKAPGKGFVYTDVEAPMGWLVTFPKGHSIHVETMDEMKRQGFDQTEVPLVDEDGEVIDTAANIIDTVKVRKVGKELNNA